MIRHLLRDLLDTIECRRRGHDWYPIGASYALCARCDRWEHADLPTCHGRD